MRDPGLTRWTTTELRDLRRDLAASLGLAAPASPTGVVIGTQIAAIDTELARRAGTGPAQAGQPGAAEISGLAVGVAAGRLRPPPGISGRAAGDGRGVLDAHSDLPPCG